MKPPRVGAEARDQERPEARGRRSVLVCAVAGGAAAAVAMTMVLTHDRDPARTPVSADPAQYWPSAAATPVSEADPGVVPSAVLMPRLRPSDYESLSAGAPRLNVSDPVPLSSDPPGRAVLAVVPGSGDLTGDARLATVAVLGEDGRWRSVDVPDLVPTRDASGYQGYALSPTSLSPDGTRLALAQPRSLVVVDLTTSDHRRYDVPALNQAASWRDDDTVLVSVELRDTVRAVDLTSGAVHDTTLDPTTRFLPDGSWVAWPRQGGLLSGAGAVTSPALSGDAGADPTVPLADDDVAVVLTSYARRTGPSSTRHGALGAAVVDRHTGEVLAVQPSMVGNSDLSQLLALDGDEVLLSKVQPRSPDRLLLRWSWSDAGIEPVAVTRAAMMSWAGPGSAADALVR
jgi:hypothetical protein